MYLIIIILSILAISGLILTKKTHDKKYLSLIIISLMFIPTSIYALKKIEITIKSKTTIYQKYSIYYKFYNPAFGIYMKESDKDKNMVLGCEETPSLYVTKEDDTIVPYINCTTVFFKHPKDYIENEEVQLDEVELELADPYDISNCNFNQETNKTTCSKEAYNDVVTKISYKTFYYSENNNENYKESDYEKMDFSKKELTQHDEYSITFGIPNSFKMLNHDIYLDQSTRELQIDIQIDDDSHF